MLCLADEESMCHPVSLLMWFRKNALQSQSIFVPFGALHIYPHVYVARLIIPRMSLANHSLKALPEER